ncbi:MAG: hypothetical protein J1F22_00650 [Lachnospiraceae bacterium]|nr:hypothetical protein [Lachnospiraceae bacterium]
METAKKSLIEVIAGIWVIAGIVILAGVFWVSNPLAYVLGELAGSLTATLMMLHLYHSLDIEMDLARKNAVTHSRIMSVVRSVLEIAVLAGSLFIPQWVSPVTVFIGLFSRKISALTVPVLNQWRENRKNDNKTEAG